ncbi:hybrid sensor histidine kinase/response regulator [Hyalangium rubrum]|uniref:histidine kinase n=1 Tax=Hyalangium rubrum TaxID=3103134 RepID=A0ABU5GXC5_9BACT|nr:ATP-binding protein [Hyalangium sp. s54d21]MDY7225846.1 ATP-binding protein [Hyalangium sp. s54d21]
MSPRRTAPPPAETLPPAPRPAEPRDGLLRKYQELFAKHAALVQRLELRTDEHVSSYRLSTWALETSASALALLRGSVVLLANRRWHELSRDSFWRRVRQDKLSGEGLCTLRQVAEAASLTLRGMDSQGPLVERYQEHGGERTLEVRTERVAMHRKPGTHHAVLVLAHDITEQVRSEQELERARETLHEQEHLRALGEMASGVAHDLNNTLNAMRLRLELTQRDATFTPSQRAHLDAMSRIVNDASTRIHRLQDFARQRVEPDSEQVQLADVVQEAVEIAHSEMEHRAAHSSLSLRLVVEVPSLPLVHGSATDLRYVFINLLLNARDAMPHGGTIRVRGGVQQDKVVITVEDEGTGIPAEHLRSIFRPFFTTKGRQGTGLGLSMAYGVMARAGGTIHAANRPGGGAVFTLCFPLLEQSALAALPAPAAPPPVTQPALTGRVLVVDDDPSNLEVTLLAIQSQGPSAEGVRSGQEALERLRQGQRYSLVLCDIGLRGMDGWQVASKARALDRKLPIYLMTGSTLDFDPKDRRLRSIKGVLLKPLGLTRLREMLAQTAPPMPSKAQARKRAARPGGKPKR